MSLLMFIWKSLYWSQTPLIWRELYADKVIFTFLNLFKNKSIINVELLSNPIQWTMVMFLKYLSTFFWLRTKLQSSLLLKNSLHKMKKRLNKLYTIFWSLLWQILKNSDVSCCSNKLAQFCRTNSLAFCYPLHPLHLIVLTQRFGVWFYAPMGFL